MTQTPDRIWAWWFTPSKRNDDMSGGWHDRPDRKDAQYLLSTPAREAADELVEALLEARPYVPDHHGPIAMKIDAALAKAKGSDNE